MGPHLEKERGVVAVPQHQIGEAVGPVPDRGTRGGHQGTRGGPKGTRGGPQGGATVKLS